MSTELKKTFAAAVITSEAAHSLIQLARQASRDIGFEAAIAVTDAAGHLKAFERSDATPFLAAGVAIDKAWTSASFGLATHTWNTIVADSVVAPLAHHSRVVAVGGGLPIYEQGRLVGAIGISGGNALQDQQAGERALEALGFTVAA